MKRKHPLQGRANATTAKLMAGVEKMTSMPNVPRVGEHLGKPYVNVSHTLDLIFEDEVLGQADLKAGEYIFPSAYLYKHGSVQFVGYVKDAVATEENGWKILLEDAILLGDDGEPVLFDGVPIDFSGWYLEDVLIEIAPEDGGGKIQLRPGMSVKTTEYAPAICPRDAVPRDAWKSTPLGQRIKAMVRSGDDLTWVKFRLPATTTVNTSAELVDDRKDIKPVTKPPERFRLND